MSRVKMTKFTRTLLFFLSAYIVVLFILIVVKFLRVVQG
jgi:hypothetical protein